MSTNETLPITSQDISFYEDERDDPFSLSIFNIFLAIVTIIVSAIATGLYFLLLHFGWGDGLQFLIPAFFLYACAEYFYYRYSSDEGIPEEECEED
ncbi:MAG: hypothetical protein PHR36_05530 [Patescibacteria group bacterium]|nr:hypothetical protein [Patescibacteria group bacterium]